MTVPQSQCLLKSLCRAIVPCVLVGRAEFLSCAVSPRRPSKTISCPEDAKSLERQSLVEGLQMVLPREADGRGEHWPGVKERAGSGVQSAAFEAKDWIFQALQIRPFHFLYSSMYLVFSSITHFLHLVKIIKFQDVGKCSQICRNEMSPFL